MLPPTLLALLLALAPGNETCALRSVTWIDVEASDVSRARHPGTTLVWRGDELLAIGPDAEVHVPEGARELDGAGAFVVPGLIDMHVHLAGAGDATFEALVRHGVTGARDLGGDLGELDATLARIERGELLGPRVARAGLVVEDARWFRNVRALQVEAGAPEAERLVRTRLPVASVSDAEAALERVVASGADLLKLRNAPPPDALRALLRGAAEAGLRVAAHEPGTIDLVEAAALGLGSLEHPPIHALLADTPSERWETIAAALRENDVCVTPTLVAMQGRELDGVALRAAVDARLANDELAPELAARWREQVAERLRETGALDWADLARRGDEVLRRLHEAGVPFLAGTDLGVALVPPGAGLHDELVLLVDRIGLTPLEALHAATVEAAAWLGWSERGALRAGGCSDLVVLDADPLTDVANVSRIRAVVCRGQVVGQASTRQAWVGHVTIQERAVPYLVRVESPASGEPSATLDRLDEIGPAAPTRSVEVTADSLTVFLDDPDGRAWALVLEREESALQGALELDGGGGTAFAATFVAMAELAPARLATLVGDYTAEDGERLQLAADEDGFLVARREGAQARMLFPASPTRFFAGPGPTRAVPEALTVEVREGTLEWRENGAVLRFRRVPSPAVLVALDGEAIACGDLRLPLVRLAPGTFDMGQRGTTAEVLEQLGMEASGPPGPEPDPVRPTTLTRPAALATVETTNAWFAAFVAETGHMTDAERAGFAFTWNGTGLDRTAGVTWRAPGFPVVPDAPVVFVSWNDATAFCAWLTGRLGRIVRLPTEAEWEYACAAGTTTLFSCGDELEALDAGAWSTRNASGPRPVGTRAANPWGLHDLHGNVWEWCRDAWAPISAEPAVDPTGPERGRQRILRGGSWINGPFSLRTSFRGRDPATLAEPHIGFRVAVELD